MFRRLATASSSQILRRGLSTQSSPKIIAWHKKAILFTSNGTDQSATLLNLKHLLCATQIGDRHVHIQMTHDLSFDVHFKSALEVDPFLKHMFRHLESIEKVPS
jgi:hypothetical protein